MKLWCTKCEREAESKCETHASSIKRLDSLAFTEEDRAVVLLLIDKEQSISWKMALKLYEAMKEFEAGEQVVKDDRDVVEREIALWEEMAQEILGDTGEMSPREMVAAAREKLLEEARVSAREGVAGHRGGPA